MRSTFLAWFGMMERNKNSFTKGGTMRKEKRSRLVLYNCRTNGGREILDDNCPFRLQWKCSENEADCS